MRLQARCSFRESLVDTSLANLAEHSQVPLATWPATQAELGQALIRIHSRDAIRLLVVAMSLLAAPQLLVVSLVAESDHITLLQTGSLYEWFGVVLLAVGSFVVAYFLWYGLLERNRMDQVAPFAMLMPLVGMFNGVMFFDETLTQDFLLGAVLVLGGLVMTIVARDARTRGGVPPGLNTPAG